MNNVHAAAHEYAAQGFPVLPLQAGGKEPEGSLVPHGHLNASVDPAQIDRWFASRPSLNIGIGMGESSGYITVDIDPRNGGTESFVEFEERYGKLPATRTAKTGGYGLHLLFSIPADYLAKLSTRTGVAGFNGVDIKASGYVVAAPSGLTGTKESG